MILRNSLDAARFNPLCELPFELRLDDFRSAVQDVYDFFHDVNAGLTTRGLDRLDDMLRPAIMSGLLFVYKVDNESEPARARKPMSVTEIYLGRVTIDDFRRNERGELGTRTATLHAQGIAKLRRSWVYRV